MLNKKCNYLRFEIVKISIQSMNGWKLKKTIKVLVGGIKVGNCAPEIEYILNDIDRSSA